MDKQLLQQFFQQEHMRKEVYAFIKQNLDEIALARVYKGQDTKGIADALEALVQTETKLKQMFTEKRDVKDPQRAV